MPNPREVAELVVRGVVFRDWLSVWVQHRAADGWPQFRFTSAEREPYPLLWEKVQHVPGDTVVIRLAGADAISGGYIITRQVAYDSKNHQVMLHGMGRTWYAATSSVISETFNYDGKNIVEVADEVWAPWPVDPLPFGDIDMTPFKKLRAQPGETTWNFIERIARVRGVVLGNTDNGGRFILIGKHTGPVTATLVEGRNILKCQCVITKKDIFSLYLQTGQTPPDDKKWGEAANQMKCGVYSKRPPPAPGRILLTPAEQPVHGQGELCTRADYERQWHDGADIQATVTVQGWLRPGTNDIWRVRDDVSIYSPMALLRTGDDRPVIMKIQNATFTQDNQSGTLTTLDLVRPELLNDRLPTDIGMPPTRTDTPPDQSGGPMQAPEPFNSDNPADMAVPRGSRPRPPSGDIPE